MLEKIPTAEELAALLGQPLFDLWTALIERIDEQYDMEKLWDRGGKDWTYEYKYRRGGKVLCALYVREKGIGLRIILGKNELLQFEANRAKYPAEIQQAYDKAKLYPEGKWVMFQPNDPSQLDHYIELLRFKRRPNRK